VNSLIFTFWMILDVTILVVFWLGGGAIAKRAR
jgi:hypothetical protein